jgi:putative molybdopterin biosynthesis protein
MADIPSRGNVTPANDGRQTQFLTVITRDEATERFQRHLKLEPLGHESVLLADALNRVLGDDVIAEVDVPGFDRSNVDGFAVQASDTFGAGEEDLRHVALNAEVLTPGMVPTQVVGPNRATVVATGAMLPRGADSVVMVEHTELVVAPDGTRTVEINRALTAGENVSYAGTDIARGETVLRAGQMLTSREIGVLAAIGIDRVRVCRRPRVAIFSTGDEIVSPGLPSARRGAALRGHLQRRRRPLLSRREPPGRPGHRRAWCGPQAGQTDLPRRESGQARGHPAGFPDIGDLHLP